jgi:alpha-tubulin suppressor-like RCC1 family protein
MGLSRYLVGFAKLLSTLGAAILPMSCSGALMTVSLDVHHACATTAERIGKCWGQDGHGELGDGTISATPRSNPLPVSNLGPATSVTSGHEHSCAILETTEVNCWGSNQYGQLGSHSAAASSATPQSVGWFSSPASGIPPSHQVLRNAISVASGQHHTCAALSTGQVWCWGRDFNGELGSTQINGDASEPQLVNDLYTTNSGKPKALQVAAAAQFTCARLDDGTVWCWGLNFRGQLGRGTTTDTAEPPAPVINLTDVTFVGAGQDQVCAVTNGSVKCWGINRAGLGDANNTEQSSTPLAIPNLTGAVAVAPGNNHSCALLTDGSVQCWGSNDESQLGVPNLRSSTTPVTVPNLTAVVRISSAQNSTCAVKSDATLWCWGLNWSSSLGQPDSPDFDRIAPPLQVMGL